MSALIAGRFVGDYQGMAVKNAPPLTVAVSKLESRVTVPSHHDALQARMGVSTFESRVVQETGTH